MALTLPRRQPSSLSQTTVSISQNPASKLEALSLSDDDDDDDDDDDVRRLLLPPSKPPTEEVQDKDKETLDSHVPRDSRMIRLTGVHPFNSEPPLTALFNDGFLTSLDLFYVRNHGPVPMVLDEEVLPWEFSVEGLVEKPLKITLLELVEEFEQITAPVTLVCAGNRRKEQNVVRKSKGFSWGSAGLSTALFTGTLMRNVLKRARPLRGARYVCMEGADKLPNGHYGTSVKLNWAMDPNRGIMLAHGMNGAPLRADHGRPLRVVVPGQIGGRSVKWLKRLVVTATPSDNWYHYYDNKVLPTTVTPEMSAAEPAWWKDERYAIYDLNVNSAVVFPQHNEILDTSTRATEYTVRGYAYSGGGRRVTRVEVSFDSGRSWRLADVEYPEDRYRDVDTDLFGGRLDMAWRETCFCWCFWTYRVSMLELQNCDSILVRAMDDAMTSQPRDMYWSVLGMMNNPWFRVTVNRGGAGNTRSLRFEHPTSLSGAPGWMENVKKAGGDLRNGRWGEMAPGSGQPLTPPPEEVSLTNAAVDRVFSLEEFRTGSSKERPLFVLDGHVYDGTAYLDDHPGGAMSIQAVSGTDATDEFMAIHSENAKAMMQGYHIGKLDDAGRTAINEASSEALSPTRARFLDPVHWATAILAKRTSLSHDTALFTFRLDHADQEVGLPVGQHLMLRARDPATGETVIRAYTPVSESDQRGSLDVLVKLYLPTGRMSAALDRLEPGAELDFKGPIGRFEYHGRGRVSLAGHERAVSSFVMVCGGSGVTPVFQVLRAVMEDPEDATFCTLLDGNRLEEDILCRNELDRLSRRKKTAAGGGCNIIHTLTKPSPQWTGRRGRISDDLLRQEARPVDGAMVLLCGPLAMESSARESLLGLGWKADDLVFF